MSTAPLTLESAGEWLDRAVAAWKRGETLVSNPGVVDFEYAIQAPVDETLRDGLIHRNEPLTLTFTATLADGTRVSRETRLEP